MTHGDSAFAHEGLRTLIGRGIAALRLAWQAHWRATVAAVVLAAVIGVTPTASAWLVKLVLDELVHPGRDIGFLLSLAAGVAIVRLGGTAAPHLSHYAAAQLRRALALLMQERLFGAVNAMPGLSRFEKPEFHNRLQLARDTGQNAPSQIVSASLELTQGLITVVGFFVSLIALSPVMALIVAAAVIPSIGVQLSLSRRRARMMWEISPAMRRQIFYAMLLTNVGAAKEVRLFGLGPFLGGRMRRELRSVNDAERAVDLRALRSQGSLALLGAIVAGCGMIWAVWRASMGALSIGDVSLFISGIAGVQTALATTIEQAAQAQLALLMFGSYFDIVQAEPDLPLSEAPVRLPPLRNGIEVRDVWFRYADDHPWALRGVDLFIPSAGSTALVGLNGAGKSTLVKLLCRMYDPQWGTIRWDGVDLRDVDPADLRERVGAVFQDYVCYEMTATENIGMGDLMVMDDHERIEAAARLAGISERLSELPRGFDTLLSRVFEDDTDEPETGVTLSGGQWQRVALARAFLRGHRDLLILDEPSSGLDAEAEHDVHARIHHHRVGRTSLLISHRLGAVRDADQIVVLSNGQVAERGTHAELLAAPAGYARMFELQASGYTTDHSTADGTLTGPS